MTRKIKFRGWDKRIGKMISEGLIFENGQFYKDWRDYEDMIPFEDNEFISMQCTGLHDIKGAEIYEGDIIRRPSTDGAIIGFVIWDDKCACYKVENKVNEALIRRNDLADCLKIGTLIGNKYQNSELLEED